MTNISLYSSIIQAKNGTFIPIFNSNKTVESRYNPENSCDLVLNTISKTGFFIVTGISSGILLEKMITKFPESKIIAFENNQSDIDFLMQLDKVKKLSLNRNIVFCTYENLSQEIINNYLPAVYGDFQLIQQKPWIMENPSIQESLPEIINESLRKVSADYSVQSHFGKRWQKNILTNLKLINKIKFESQSIDTTKTAAVIAAGPSLDKTIKQLKDNRSSYFIISTDTAYSSLIKNEIYPEAVISIDGQLVSYNHFFEISPTSHYYFDLCANSSSAKKLLSKTSNVHFFVSGHPFCNLVNQFSNDSFPYIFTGSGTVTISALDFALKTGFKDIQIFGADFAYLNGKSYTKGTYLDSLYAKSANRIKTLESNFDKLIFRIPLKKLISNSYTTEVLEAYKSSLEAYLEDNHCEFYKESDCYFIKNENISKNLFKMTDFDFNNFIKQLNSLSDNDLQTALLPLIAALRKNHPDKSFENLQKLARSIVVSYN